MRVQSRRIIAWSLGLIFWAGPKQARGQESKPSPLAPGETLTLDVTWSIFRAGEITATLRKVADSTGNGYEVDTTARTQGFVSLLYKVQNEFHSVFDPETGCSRGITKTISQGRQHKDIRIAFDGLRRLAVMDERDLANPDAPPKHAENEIPECALDIVSAFYFVRRQPLRVGQKFFIAVNDGTKTRQIISEVQARERIDTPLGPRMAFRLEPKVFGELLKRKGRMLIWFSDDERRLPLRIKAMISRGTVTGTLKSVTGGPASAASGKS
jgi:uncharacterized protein DUF3108